MSVFCILETMQYEMAASWKASKKLESSLDLRVSKAWLRFQSFLCTSSLIRRCWLLRSNQDILLLVDAFAQNRYGKDNLHDYCRETFADVTICFLQTNFVVNAHVHSKTDSNYNMNVFVMRKDDHRQISVPCIVESNAIFVVNDLNGQQPIWTPTNKRLPRGFIEHFLGPRNTLLEGLKVIVDKHSPPPQDQREATLFWTLMNHGMRYGELTSDSPPTSKTINVLFCSKKDETEIVVPRAWLGKHMKIANRSKHHES